MEAMSANSVQFHPSLPSQTSLAHSSTTHTHTSVSTTSPHLGHHLATASIESNSSSKLSRGGSLSLIGTARVRLAKDVSAPTHALLKAKYAVPNTCSLSLLSLQFRTLIRTHSKSSSVDDGRYTPTHTTKVRLSVIAKATPLTTVPDCAQAELSDAQDLVLPTHAPYLAREPSASDTEPESMQEPHDERKGRWAFGAKVSCLPATLHPCAMRTSLSYA